MSQPTSRPPAESLSWDDLWPHPLVTTVALVGILLLAGTVVAVAGGPEAPCADEPGCLTVDELAAGAILQEPHHILDRNDEPVASVGGTRRRWTPLDSIPTLARDAWIAVEDHRFREHGGVDLRSAFRAVVANLVGGGVQEGASTIPMQLTRVLWPRLVAERGRWTRKLFEVRMAPRLVDELGRDRVLALYLNGIYLGDGVYGIGAAARHYFGVPPARLSAAQVATLVGMTKTPERFHPVHHPRRTRARRDLVLATLVEQGVLPEGRARSARAEPLDVLERAPVENEQSYVTAAVLRELRSVAPDLAGRPGLRIHTTVDPRAQAAAVEGMRRHLDRITAGELGRYLGGDRPLQGGAIAMDSNTGEILAVVGGRDFETTQLIRPLQSRRPVGSLAKPILLASALELGRSTTRPISTDTLSAEGRDGRWRPRDHVRDGWLLPQEMVARSSNRAAVHLGVEVGIRPFADMVHTLGVDRTVPPYPSSFLGSFEASLADMTAAFATFENGGDRIQPHLVRWVEGPDGRALWRRPPDPRTPVLSREAAFLVLDAMRGVVDGGTGWRARRGLSGPAAGKTGTTDEAADAWFVGVRPGIAAGIWIGLDRPAPISEGASGGRLAAPLWGAWLARLEELGYGKGSWSRPPGLARVALDRLARGDSVVYCWGGKGAKRLVRQGDFTRTPACPARRDRAVERRFTEPLPLLEPGSVRLRTRPPDAADDPDREG